MTLMSNKRTPLLTAEEESALARAAESGDAGARERLILANQGLVFSLANQYARGPAELDDLVQEGFVGLIRAIDKFDYRRGHRLSTLATRKIDGAIKNAIIKRAKTSAHEITLGF